VKLGERQREKLAEPAMRPSKPSTDIPPNMDVAANSETV
jgi:hypothetical protein